MIQAVSETVIFFLVFFFFKAMYFNKWGQKSPFRDDLSDHSDNEIQVIEELPRNVLRNHSHVKSMVSKSSVQSPSLNRL